MEELKEMTVPESHAVKKSYKLPEETINQILEYLGNRPYKEVSQLIAEIYKNVKPITERI